MSGRPGRVRALAGLSTAILVFLASGCSLLNPDGEEQATTVPTPAALSGAPLKGDFSGAGPGTLKSANTIPTIDRRIEAMATTAARITYLSTSGVDGSQQVVSGTVFAPKGPPPQGGWPIIAFGHGSTGVLAECAPSLSPDLLGTSTLVTALLKAGYVVTVPDYQGLGLDGTYHPYLDNTTGGYNLIDSVRAARKLVPDTADRWLAFGGSEGGGAAWAANALADDYGRGLTIVGSASLVPAADMSPLADAAVAGGLTQDQGPLMQWILYALKNEHPDLNLDDYRRGIVEQKWDVLTACQGALTNERASVAQQIAPDDLRPSSPEATDRLRTYLKTMSVPESPAAAPMLVVYGGRDQLVNQQWTEGALDRACRKGDVIQTSLQPDKGHGDIDGAVAFDWINSRFDNGEAVNTCGLDDPPTGDGSTPATESTPVEDAPTVTSSLDGGGQ
jgi:acetyl esterase/lipase